jgi:hypothetical protein
MRSRADRLRRPLNANVRPTMTNQIPTPSRKDRLEAWVEDSGAICVIAVGSHGDPLDLAEHEVEAFIERLQQCLREARG